MRASCVRIEPEDLMHPSADVDAPVPPDLAGDPRRRTGAGGRSWPAGGRAVSAEAADQALAGEIAARIGERWSTYFPANPPVPSPDVVCRRTRPHAFSVLFEFEVRQADGGTKRLIAKVRRDSRDGAYRRQDVTGAAPRLLQLEHDELSKAYAYFRALDAGLEVVRPLDHLEELNTIVMEKASGCELGLLNRFDDRALLVAFERCGRWLRAYHREIHEADTRVWTPGEVDARLVQRRHRLLSEGVPAGHLDAVLDRIRRAAGACPQQPIPRSMLHGDYKLRHIWARPEAIQVFDFGNVHTGDCYGDVASFLVELTVLRLGAPWFDARKIARYSDAFLGEYFGTGPAAPLLQIYVAEGLLKKWVRRLRRWSRAGVVARAQACARKLGAASLVDRLYLDRWFEARIQESLDRLGAAGR
jgi:hypothetical protein